MEYKQKTTLRQKLILLALGFFLTIIILEAGLRLGGFIINSLQDRRNKVSLRQKGTYRILCLGESTTARQYPLFLEEALNSRSTGIKFSVIDKGVNGAITRSILANLESNLEAYHPDMVITMMGINDFGPHMLFEFTLRNQERITFWQFLRVYKLARLTWLHLVTRLRELGLSKGGNRVKSFSQQNETQNNEVELKQAIVLKPEKHSAYVNLARLYRSQDRFPEAEAVLKQGAALNIKNPDVYLVYAELARLYQVQGKLAEAEGVLKQALTIGIEAPTVYLAYAGLVRFYRQVGKLAEAEAVFKQAVALDTNKSSLSVVYAELVRFYRQVGKLAEAEGVFKQAVALNPKESRLLYRALKFLSMELGNSTLTKEYDRKLHELGLVNYRQETIDNYHKLKAILDKRGIIYVCVQYPMRSLEPLKKIFPDSTENIVFVDNEAVFMDALKQGRYEDYFRDVFGGDFGHCTDKGNRLLAENIANTLLKEVFSK